MMSEVEKEQETEKRREQRKDQGQLTRPVDPRARRRGRVR